MTRPQSNEYNPYYDRYISLVPDADIVRTLESQWAETRTMLTSIPEQRGAFRYAPGKWSIKEMLGHLIDAERIFAYRALRVARADTTPLASFEQDDYVRNGSFDSVSLSSLIEEFATVRRSTVLLLEHMQPEACTRMGTASNSPISVRALAWIIAGHELHHRAVLKEKYLAG